MNNLEDKQQRYNILVSRILTNKGQVITSVWQMGLDLLEIKDRELYLLDFRDFKTFLEKKVDIHQSTAYLMLDIVKEFTFRDFKTWGLKKLGLIRYNIPEPEERKEFVKEFYPVRSQELREQIDRFKGQIGESDTVDETKLKIARQWTIIESHYNDYVSSGQGIIQEIESWKIIAKKHLDEQINSLLVQSERILEDLE